MNFCLFTVFQIVVCCLFADSSIQRCLEPDEKMVPTSLAFVEYLSNHWSLPVIPHSLSNTRHGTNPDVEIAFGKMVEVLEKSIMHEAMRKSGCRWRYEIDLDEDRVPNKIVKAVRTRRYCYKGMCRSLKSKVRTLRKKCDNKTGMFSYEEVMEEIVTGYYCEAATQARSNRPHRRMAMRPPF